MTQKQTRELNKGKEVELVGDFSFFHLAIVSRFSIIDTHSFITSTTATQMVIDRCKDSKGVDCFHCSYPQVQVTDFSGAENLLIGCQSHCLKI